MKKYDVWKADKNGNPIDGTDRVIKAKSKRDVIKHLAHEEGVEHNHNDMVVQCNDGTLWCCSSIGYE